jgi:DNA-binding PadR family transcriptional regulator
VLDVRIYLDKIYLVTTHHPVNGSTNMTEPARRQKRVEPLKDSEFHILLALADSDRHGYGIMQEVETGSQGTVRLGPGTLYGAIKRMLASGMIEESARRPAAKDDDDRRRCYYRLTKLGRSVAEKEAHRLAELLRVAHSKQLVTWRPLALSREAR